MAKLTGSPAARVQVYFENPKIERALRREASAAKVPLSRAAEQAIARGLAKRPHADPDDRLLTLERRFSDHMRSAQRDGAIVMELIVELARALFLRLPDSAGEEDRLLQRAAGVRLERMLDDVAARIASGGAARAGAAIDEAVEERLAVPHTERRTINAPER